ncbi:MAG: hypothetical protein U0R80_13530 [Nocardioidaceae bacterium]
MTSSSLRRVSGIAILATALGLTLAPAGAAQATGTRAATSISIRVVDTRIEPGATGQVHGHLAVGAGLSNAGRTVTLEARPVGTTGFTPVAEVVSADQGGLDADVMLEVTTRYRWHYAGDDLTRPSISGVATIRVGTRTHLPHRWNTSLSIRTVHRATNLGLVDIVRGSLRVGHRGLPHRPVVLLSRTADDADWTFEDTRLTRGRGVVRFAVDPDADSSYRLAFLGTARLQPASSGIVRVDARPDVTIAADPAAITRGESTTVSGTVTAGGSALAGATVELWAFKVGRPFSRHLVGSATTADDGSVSFTDSPTRTSKYQLRVLHGDGSPAALSVVAKVEVLPAPAQ